MEPHQLVTLLDLCKDLTSTLATLAEEARELRKEHTALRQQVELIQEAVSATADRPPAQRPPSPVAALRTRYSLLFDAGEFRQAASVYAELLAAEAQGCQCRHVYRHHDTEHGGCSVCPCTWFVASQLLEENDR
jgi:hypothetical protein